MVRRSATLTDEQFARLPEELTVRVITARIVVRGFRDEEIVIVTSLLDPVRYPNEQILEWYLRRWEIEVSFRDMKTTLRYEFIRERTPHVVNLEIDILLLAYNLMRMSSPEGGMGRRSRHVALQAQSPQSRHSLMWCNARSVRGGRWRGLSPDSSLSSCRTD